MSKKAVPGKKPPRSAPDAAAGDAPGWQERFQEVVLRANAGDRVALARLKEFLDANPWLWERAGDLTAVAVDAWVRLLAGPDAFAAESVRRVVAAMKADLTGAHPTRMEALLADQVALTWLAVQHAEARAANPAGEGLPQAAFRLKRAESAQKRHLTAVKTLATLRALVPRGMAPIAPLKLYAPAAAAG